MRRFAWLPREAAEALVRVSPDHDARILVKRQSHAASVALVEMSPRTHELVDACILAPVRGPRGPYRCVRHGEDHCDAGMPCGTARTKPLRGTCPRCGAKALRLDAGLARCTSWACSWDEGLDGPLDDGRGVYAWTEESPT